MLTGGSSSGQEAKREPERVLRAGAATSNITPPLGGPIIGGWRPIKAAHIHDELHARCLVLDDGTTRLVFVVCDNLGLPREVCDAAKRLIEEAIGIPTDHIMISGTHTHSAVSARGPNRLVYSEKLTDYQQFIATRIADGVRCALNNLEPARIGWGSAEEPTQVFNRRWYMKPGPHLRNPFGGEDKVRMNPGRGNPNLLEPAGPTDPEVAFLSVQSTDGRPIALLANYGLHYVGGVGRGHVSADYFAMFADRIKQILGADRLEPPFVGIMSNGTSGDINNIDFTRKGERRAPYEKMREVAHLVARDVHEAHENVEFSTSVELGAAQEELTLAVRKPTDELLAYMRKIKEKPDDAEPYHSREKVYADRVLQVAESPDEVSVILQAFRIGDLAITAIPFEVFAEIGLELKEKGPLGQTFTISHANGSYGYLPTPRHHKLGGYETWLGTNVVEVQASTKIVRSLLSMMERLK
ncbi:MAG: neutral/alkaline non-lysosomal ceramidase N-terminal domain-containing protein [Armatimonadota bacterium]|jgi:hypothetical protein